MAKSSLADTPAPVRMLPSFAMRWLTAIAPKASTTGKVAQCEVARLPFGSPVLRMIMNPVHILVMCLARAARADPMQ